MEVVQILFVLLLTNILKGRKNLIYKSSLTVQQTK